jgi:purine nucleosidase
LKNVLLFSDFGVDDAVAIIFAYFCKEINLVGVVADYGNVSRENALANASYLEELTGVKTVPVFGGAELALTGERPVYYPEVHGEAGLGPIIPNIKVNEDLFENFDGIKALIEKYKNDLYIVNIGRLSSLATAFILYPNLMGNVKEFYIMGGAFLVPGNVTQAAEANFFGDPYAARILINQAPKKLHICPLDVTMSAIITPATINSLHAYYESTNNKLGLIIKPMVDFYYSFYQTSNPGISGSPMHDTFTLWSILDEAKVEWTEVPVQVVVDRGIAFGESIGDFRKKPETKENDYKIHKVATQFNYAAFIKSFFEIMRSSIENINEKQTRT